MEPVLQAGDKVLIVRSSRAPDRYELVLVSDPWIPEKIYVKRCIGLANEVLEIREKRVYINNRLLEKDPGFFNDPTIYGGEDVPLIYAKRDNLGPMKIPAQHYFMMGDNRDFSSDSRYFGLVPQSRIKGQVLLVFWPAPRTRILW